MGKLNFNENHIIDELLRKESIPVQNQVIERVIAFKDFSRTEDVERSTLNYIVWAELEKIKSKK